ncbi:MAG: Gfo/Idh/MocA family oxidoreductase, partial [bacterium]|nr:Gfo/Idh/MocA family oxidoreductase [bacterium]
MSKLNRRTFVKTSTCALALTAAQYRVLAQGSANDKISMGFIGIGGMGTGRLTQFMQHEDVHVAGICDIDQSHLDQGLAEVEKRKEYKPEGYRDFRKLLERNDIDAAVVTTPDHWHALPFITACNAGKDVFVEKPLCYSIGEGRAMVEAAKKGQRITQMGNHIHNDMPNYRRVVEMVQSGNLGKISKVYCWHQSSSKGIGTPANAEPPQELDYEFWLGPAPKRPYNQNRSHFNYRYFWDYSGGDFMDFWCHITDVVYWALALQAPISVSATGRREGTDDNAETPNYLDVQYEYPDLTLLWSVQPNPYPGYEHMGSIGAVFVGSEATLVTNYSKHEIYVKGEKKDDFAKPEASIPDSPGH